MRFYKYSVRYKNENFHNREEHAIYEYEEQFCSIYDVVENRLNIDAGCFNNDFFLPYKNNTYYFRPFKTVTKSGFQLYKHDTR